MPAEYKRMRTSLQLRTEAGVSPSVTGGEVLTSLIVLTALYGALAVVDAVLMVRYARVGPPPERTDAEPEPVFAY